MTPTPKPSDLRRLLAAQPQDQLDDIGFQAMARDALDAGGYTLPPAEEEDARPAA
jgi:hypothetical protein